MKRPIVGVLLFIGALFPVASATPDSDALLGLINDFRASAHGCPGASAALAGPLAAHAALARAASGGDPHKALPAAGYAAARSLAITVTGPRDAAATMRVLAENYCLELANARYSEIGIARDGRRWRIVLAQPVLAPDLESSREAGSRILELVNAARAEPRRCGNRVFPAVPPVAWNARLAATALAHSSDMARRDYFAHTGPDGTQVGARATGQGYDWRTIGENIAAGQGSARQVTAGWLASPGHCSNIMNGDFTEMGAAYAVNRQSTSTIYWTQVFGSRR